MQTAVSNARNKIEERLARWLLMADDRIDGDELPLTHEFLAMMLARPSQPDSTKTKLGSRSLGSLELSVSLARA